MMSLRHRLLLSAGRSDWNVVTTRLTFFIVSVTSPLNVHRKPVSSWNGSKSDTHNRTAARREFRSDPTFMQLKFERQIVVVVLIKARRWLFIELRSINFAFAWFSRRPPRHMNEPYSKRRVIMNIKSRWKETGNIKWKEQKAASCYTCWYCDSRAGDIVSMRARKNMKLKLILNPRHSKNIIRSATHTQRATKTWVTERKQESSERRR